MSLPVRNHGSLARRTTLALAASTVVAASGCDVPAFQGPQIQSPPPAFTRNPEAADTRVMFPDLPVAHKDAWVEASWGNFSGIFIHGHPGILGPDEVDAARTAAMAARAGERDRVEFGELEMLKVDGRTAWGWGETWRMADGGIRYVAFRAAIPYDTISYAVEFVSGEPGFKIRPDSLRTIVASFAIGVTTWNLPLIAGLGAVLLLAGYRVHVKRQERAARHRSVPLVRIPKKEGTPPEGGTPGAGAKAPERDTPP